MTLLKRQQPAPASSSPDQIVWGVRRRRGYHEIDDPSAHRGLVQHAFVVGRYNAALCGARTYGWRKPRHVRLAVPTLDNPMCRSCSVAIAFEVSAAVSIDRIAAVTKPVAREDYAHLFEPVFKLLLAGEAVREPVQIDDHRYEHAELRRHAWPVKDFSRAA